VLKCKKKEERLAVPGNLSGYFYTVLFLSAVAKRVEV
jgi:hypothetical protein